MLSNAYFLAKFRFDTAENEPAKISQNFRKMHFRKIPERRWFDRRWFDRVRPGGMAGVDTKIHFHENFRKLVLRFLEDDFSGLTTRDQSTSGLMLCASCR